MQLENARCIGKVRVRIMKISKETKQKMSILIVAEIIFFLLLIGINNYIERKLEIKNETQTEEKIYKKHIAMINEDPSEEFWTSIYQSAKAEGEKQSIYIENFGEKFVEDFSTAELMEMAIAAKVDGIIVRPDASVETGETMKRAEKENIPVMTILSDVKDSGRFCFVSGNDYAIGEMYGNQIAGEVAKRAEHKDGKVKVEVLIDAASNEVAPNLIYSGISETTASMGNQMELSSSVVDNSSNFESEEMVRNLLLGDEIPDVLVCLSVIDTISAYQSVIEYNCVGKTSIIGYYISKDTLEGIEKGIIKGSVLIDPESLGKTCVKGMEQYMNQGYVNEYLTVSPILIVEDNVQRYIESNEQVK